MAIRTTDNDKLQKRIQREMRRLNRSFVTAGVHRSAGSYPGERTTVAMVAAFNEFGTSRIPSRPFIRNAVDTNRAKLNAMSLLEFRAISGGRRTAKQALDRIGFSLMSMIQTSIQRSPTWAVPNAPSTARRKRRGGALRGPTPLINTGLMLRSITFKTTLRGR